MDLIASCTYFSTVKYSTEIKQTLVRVSEMFQQIFLIVWNKRIFHTLSEETRLHS